MNHIEKGWIGAAQMVSTLKENIATAKQKQMIYRINKKAYEMALRERKTLMNAAMRAGEYAEVSRHHKVVNILRAQLKQEVGAIRGMKTRIKAIVMNIGVAEKRRDQFERAYRLVEAADALAMANAEIMNDVPVVPMGDGDMEQIVRDLGY
ncbi:MAG: hypothetical protein ACRCXB_13625 [Aeromonadaceae bacterium]